MALVQKQHAENSECGLDKETLNEYSLTLYGLHKSMKEIQGAGNSEFANYLREFHGKKNKTREVTADFDKNFALAHIIALAEAAKIPRYARFMLDASNDRTLQQQVIAYLAQTCAVLKVPIPNLYAMSPQQILTELEITASLIEGLPPESAVAPEFLTEDALSTLAVQDMEPLVFLKVHRATSEDYTNSISRLAHQQAP